MATPLREPPALEQDAAPLAGASRRAGSRVRRGMGFLRIPVLALTMGCVAAVLLLGSALRTEFPLFSEASAERGRDCIRIASAHHALDATLQARLPLTAPDAETARAVRSAVAAFDARTQDLATDSVASALGPVRGALSALSDGVQVAAAAPDAASDDAIQHALAGVGDAWRGAIARVCS